MEPSLLRKMTEQSVEIDVDEQVFAKFQILLDSINDGLNKSPVKITPPTEPYFVRTPRG